VVRDPRYQRSAYRRASCLIFHEANDPARLARVREEIADEAVQGNPVIGAPSGVGISSSTAPTGHAPRANSAVASPWCSSSSSPRGLGAGATCSTS
jgi:hypothetical protein